MNKKRIIPLLLTFLMVFALASCKSGVQETPDREPAIDQTIVEEPGPESASEPEPEPEPEPASAVAGSLDLTDVSNYWVEIGGTKYSIGDPYSKFAADFEVNRFDEGLGDEVLDPYYMVSVAFMFKDSGGNTIGSMNVRFVNLSDGPKPVRECNAGAILGLDQFTTDKLAKEGIDHSFAGGLKIGTTTRAEAEALLGEPDDFYEGDADGWDRATYYPIMNEMGTYYDTYVYYKVSYSNETDLLFSVEPYWIEEAGE